MTESPVRSREHRLQVEHVVDLTPRMRRVVFRAPSLTTLPLIPAQDVALQLTDDDGRPARRRYTIRAVDTEAETLALDGLQHGHGPGARWFTDVQPGDEIDVLGPRGKGELFDADWHLFVADEAGWPAVAEFAAALPDPSAAHALIEVTDAADEWDLGLATTWVHRGGAEPGSADLLAAHLTELTHQPQRAGSGAGYLMGESRAVVQLRPLLPSVGVDPDRVFLKGYWNRGRASR